MKCWLQITSGRGPLECCWVVHRLAITIINQAPKEQIKASVIDDIPGSKPDTSKSVLLELTSSLQNGKNNSSENILLFANQWKGTIQWVGKSQYRPHHKRKNWFVGVEIYTPPEEGKWKFNELKIETMRSSGPGGQHVNKTESAVRVTHLPTNISVIAREERSQLLNKKLALARLDKLIHDYQEHRRNASRTKRWQAHNELERGNPAKIYLGQKFILAPIPLT